MASTVHDLIMTPFDMVKQRMQLGYYRSVSHCVSSVARLEGFPAFYRSLPTTMVMNLPYGCIMVAANESAKKVLNPSGKYNFMSTLISGCLAGGVAAAFTTPLDVIKTRLQTQDLEPVSRVASSSSHNAPVVLSVVRGSVSQSSASIASASLYTRTPAGAPLSSAPLCESMPYPATVGVASARYVGSLQTAKVVFTEEGMKGFFRGLGARVLVHAPSVAISWTTYETIKHLLISMRD
jgi:solute carrier family 25 iron transporter 28/37